MSTDTVGIFGNVHKWAALWGKLIGEGLLFHLVLVVEKKKKQSHG